MNDLWTDIDQDVLGALQDKGAVEPAEIGRQLGVSEDSAASLLCSLVMQGKVRIKLVELAS